MLTKIRKTISHIFESKEVQINGLAAAWKKVDQLKVGMKITVPENEKEGSGVVWDEITSIKKVGRKQVWDIEVEGTHNFVGNGIVAHNTYISGNLGIGTTNPLQKLQVAGDINIESGSGVRINNTATSTHYLRGDGTRFVSSAIQVGDLPTIPSAGGWTDDGSVVRLTTVGDLVGIGYADPGTAKLAINGNVGIGTTSPVQKLHVEGQCVTGDTLLAVAKTQNSKLKAQSYNLKLKTEEIEYKEIKNIKGGEYVYSLNEETGKIEPQRIKELLDMGIKPVFRLTTENGKEIRTTGNHPYLVKGNRKLSAGFFGASDKSRQNQQNNPQTDDGQNKIESHQITHNLLLSINNDKIQKNKAKITPDRSMIGSGLSRKTVLLPRQLISGPNQHK